MSVAGTWAAAAAAAGDDIAEITSLTIDHTVMSCRVASMTKLKRWRHDRR